MDDKLDLSHIIGLSSYQDKTPLSANAIGDQLVFAIGRNLVISDVSNVHNQKLLRGHTRAITSIDVSHENNLIASGQMNEGTKPSTIIIWDIKQEAPIHILPAFKSGVKQLLFSRDGEFVAAIAEDEPLLVVWDTATGDLVDQYTGSVNPQFLSWGPAEHSRSRPSYMLCTTDGPGAMHLTLKFDRAALSHRIYAQRMLLPASGLVRELTCGVVDLSGGWLVCGTPVGEALLFDLRSHRYAGVTKHFPAAASFAVRTGPHVVIGSREGHLARLDAAKDWRRSQQHTIPGGLLALTSAGEGVAGCTRTGALITMPITLSSPSRRRMFPASSITSSCVSRASPGILYCGTHGGLQCWSLDSYDLMQHFSPSAPGRAPLGRCTALCTDGEVLYSGWETGSILAHQLTESHANPIGERVLALPAARRGSVTVLSVGPDGLLACGGQDGQLMLWNQHGTLVRQIACGAGITSVQWDCVVPGLLHVCTADGSVRCFDSEDDLRRVKQRIIPTGYAQSCDQILAGRSELVTSVSDGSILFWDFDLADPVQSITLPESLRPGRHHLIAVAPGAIASVGNTDDDGDQILITLEPNGREGDWRGSDSQFCSGMVLVNILWTCDRKQIIGIGESGIILVWNYFSD